MTPEVVAKTIITLPPQPSFLKDSWHLRDAIRSQATKGMTYNWKFKVSEHSLIYIYIISKIFLSSIMSCQSDFCRSSLKYSFTASMDSRLICKTSRKKEHFNALNAIGSHEIEIAASWKLQFFTLPSNSNKIAQKTRDKWATWGFSQSCGPTSVIYSQQLTCAA